MYPKYGWLFRVLALICLIGPVYLGSMSPGTGFEVSCVNGNCIAAASTSWYALALASITLALVLLFPRPKSKHLQASGKRAGYWRRPLALLVDFALLMVVFAPMSLVPLLFEWRATGEFAWSFHREFARPTDWVTAPLVFAFFAAIYFYYDRASRSGRQTIGQFILGYRVTLTHRNWQSPIGGMFGLFAYLGVIPQFLIQFTREMNKTSGLDRLNPTIDPMTEVKYELVKIDFHRPRPSNGT